MKKILEKTNIIKSFWTRQDAIRESIESEGEEYEFCFKSKIILCRESGRSMIEMLAVLALMGILSVSGIAMYMFAMNKHRANELLYEISKRAAVVAMQVASGKSGEALSVAEFGDTKYNVTDTGLSGQFAITVDNVDRNVCANLLNTVSDKTAVRYIALKTSPQTKIITCEEGASDYAFVFNNNMRASDSEDEVLASADCSNPDENGKCHSTCPEGTSINGQGGYALSLSDGNMCYCETFNMVYKEGKCQEKPERCSSFKDCNSGEFCYLEMPDSCTIPTEGNCESLSYCSFYNWYENFWVYGEQPSSGIKMNDSAQVKPVIDIDLEDDPGDFPLPPSVNCRRNSWVLEDVCKAKGMRLVSLSDLHCNKDGCTDTEVISHLPDHIYTSDIYTDTLDYEEPAINFYSVNSDGSVNHSRPRKKGIRNGVCSVFYDDTTYSYVCKK